MEEFVLADGMKVSKGRREDARGKMLAAAVGDDELRRNAAERFELRERGRSLATLGSRAKARPLQIKLGAPV
jgi:hypothetical protein